MVEWLVIGFLVLSRIIQTRDMEGSKPSLSFSIVLLPLNLLITLAISCFSRMPSRYYTHVFVIVSELTICFMRRPTSHETTIYSVSYFSVRRLPIGTPNLVWLQPHFSPTPLATSYTIILNHDLCKAPAVATR